ncbi:MAG: NUDIX hydrolase [Saccharofermentans sp.]|nr:NUDIX hydrolase [Saccharofermentans sp.]
MNDGVKDPGYILNLRRELGHRPIIMAGAGVIVINEKGEILLEKRRDNGYWDYPAGSMELGESFEECARREVFEETGIKCGELVFFTTRSGGETFYTYPNGDQIFYAGVIYFCRDFSGTLNAQEDEVSDLKFFDPERLPEELTPVNLKLFNEVRSFLKNSGENNYESCS